MDFEVSQKLTKSTVRGTNPLLVATVAVVFFLSACSPKPEPSAPPSPEVSLSDLVRVEDRLHLDDDPTPFTGIMLEHYPDGTLKSRSKLVDGVLHGASEGWHPNGALQVREQFTTGIANGTRYRWFDDGAPHTQAEIVNGQLHGTFLRWHENGALAERIEMSHGEPDGISLAYYASGYLKASVEMTLGKVVRQSFWKDGETRQPPVMQAQMDL